jgi:hypothetical protein
MNIKKKILQDALEIVRPGIASGDMIDQASSFAFIDGDVVSYNDEISIRHPLSDLSLTGAVRADLLYKFLSKITNEDIEISTTEGDMIIQAGRAKASIKFESEIRLPLKELETKKEFIELPEGFIDALQLVVASSGNDVSKPKLTCVHINNKGFVEASDGLRIAHVAFDNAFSFDTLLIPARSIFAIIKLSPTKIALTDGWCHFSTKANTVLSCRIYENDVFPDTAEWLNVEGVSISLPVSINEIFERAIVFAKRDKDLKEWIRITIGKNRFSIHAQSDDGSTFNEDVNFKYSDEPITFDITPMLLKNILAKTSTCTITDDRLKFGESNWSYVTALRSKIK